MYFIAVIHNILPVQSHKFGVNDLAIQGISMSFVDEILSALITIFVLYFVMSVIKIFWT